MLKNLRSHYIRSNRTFDTRSIIAFSISFFLHLIIVIWFVWDFPKENLQHLEKYGSQEKERINIRDFKFVPPSKGELAPPQNEKLATKPLNQDIPVIKKEEVKPKEKKLKTAKSKPAPQKVEINPKKEDLPPTLAEESKSKSNPVPPSAASSPSIYSLGKNAFGQSNKEMEELYGEDLHSLSLEERKFLEDNLKAIGKITQSYLKYPRVAGRTGQQGINVVEFYLYPNGNISDLKLLTSSGYALLDNNSKHTIEIAYKDYPYPSVTTKIRIKVYYSIR